MERDLIEMSSQEISKRCAGGRWTAIHFIGNCAVAVDMANTCPTATWAVSHDFDLHHIVIHGQGVDINSLKFNL